eukprot:12111549-Alexandrium_andersonii.AAC.1
MEADPRHAELLAAMLGPKASALSAPGARESGQARDRLTGPMPAHLGVDDPAAGRARKVRFALGAGAEEGLSGEPPAAAAE